MKKVFLSYSTENADHQQWVIDLGNQLTTHGIDNTIDVHELKLGQDMYAFMERVVSDEFDHVIILSDASYVRKANARTGGVGAEVQLLAPQIYNAIDQTRIIPVFTEFDEKNEPTLPTFLKGRFALDFSDPENYEQQYAKLCLAILGKSQYEKKELGNMPNIEQLQQMAARKKNKTKTEKNILKKDVFNIKKIRVGDTKAKDGEQYDRKNIVEGSIDGADELHIGDIN